MSARNPRSHQGLQHSFGITEVDVKQWEDRLSIAWSQLTDGTLTTDGDILFYNSGLQRLAKGSDDQVLTLASGVPTWAAAAEGVTDHGALTGLGDDDHDQYALIAGDTFTGGVTLNVGADAASILTVGEVSTLRGNAQDGRIQFYGENAAAIAGMLISHSGSNLQFSANQGTTNIQFIPSSYVEVLDGKSFRIRDATNSDLASWAHDGTDFNLVMTQTADYNISGITNLQVAANILSNGTAVSLAGHTHVEANITDLDKYTVAAADAAFAAISHTHVENDITDLGNYLPISAGTNNRLSGYLYIDSADPRIRMNESDATANNRLWDFIVNGNEFRFQCRSDDEATATNFMVVQRNANLATKINFFATNLQHNSVDVALVKMTTNGDILYYNSGRQRLAKGSDGEVLTLASGIPSWAAAGGGGISVTVSTSAASGGGNQGDLWCRI